MWGTVGFLSDIFVPSLFLMRRLIILFFFFNAFLFLYYNVRVKSSLESVRINIAIYIVTNSFYREVESNRTLIIENSSKFH